MISMSDYKQIIQLRNKGKTQSEIASIVGISRRSVLRYLKDGKIPIYSRERKSNRPDPMSNFYDLVKEKLESNSKTPLNEIFEFICMKGYQGSERTLRRKTRDLRLALKNNEVFFQREVLPGEVMEGDFTEFHIEISGIKRKIYLWVTSLPFSNAYFATPYYHCSFEAFSDGSVKSFNEFGGLAKKYRLDNMSPAVSKILSGKNRIVTQRFSQLQSHYNFEQDFCNPARGNEKGNVESNNKFIKAKINARISLYDLSFCSLDAFKVFVWEVCRDHNKRESVSAKFSQELLSPLPQTDFKCFRTTVVSINKYSLFNLERTGHMYSVPSRTIGLSLEVRVYPSFIEVIYEGAVLCKHNRVYGQRGLVSIAPEHVIDGLLKKPGAMKDWKYRSVLFERPAWNIFYNKLISKGGKDKEYLKCLSLISKHGRELVTLAMEISMEGDEELSSVSLSKLITNDMNNIHEIQPLEMDLHHYDVFLNGEENGSELTGVP
jgi:transposase